MVNNFPDAEPSTSFGMAMFSNLAAWRVKDETSEDDKSSEVRYTLPHTAQHLTYSSSRSERMRPRTFTLRLNILKRIQ